MKMQSKSRARRPTSLSLLFTVLPLLVVWFAGAEDIYRIRLIWGVIVLEMIGVNGRILGIGTDTVLRAMLIACALADEVPAAGGDETLEAT
jgi:hypothetical protein